MVTINSWERRARRGLELLSGLAGISFVASGAINGLIFYFEFGLNYFQIASIGDTILSSFLVLGYFLIGIPVSLFIAVSIITTFQIVWNFLRVLWKRGYRLYSIIIGAITIILISFVMWVVEDINFDFGWFLTTIYESNLVFDAPPEMAQCGLADVRWTGENSAVIQCEDGTIRVLYGLENINFYKSLSTGENQ